jgi:hypothetical protein
MLCKTEKGLLTKKTFQEFNSVTWALIDFLSNYMLQHKSWIPKPSNMVFSYTYIILRNGNVNHTNSSCALGFNTGFLKVKCDFQAKKIVNFVKSILYNKNTAVKHVMKLQYY